MTANSADQKVTLHVLLGDQEQSWTLLRTPLGYTTPADFALDVPAGVSFYAWLECQGRVAVTALTGSQNQMLPNAEGWDIRDYGSAAQGESPHYRMSQGVELRATVHTAGETRRVLDSTLLSGYAQAETGAFPFKSGTGLDWLQLLQPAFGAPVGELMVTMFPPADAPESPEEPGGIS